MTTSAAVGRGGVRARSALYRCCRRCRAVLPWIHPFRLEPPHPWYLRSLIHLHRQSHRPHRRHRYPRCRLSHRHPAPEAPTLTAITTVTAVATHTAGPADTAHCRPAITRRWNPLPPTPRRHRHSLHPWCRQWCCWPLACPAPWNLFANASVSGRTLVPLPPRLPGNSLLLSRAGITAAPPETPAADDVVEPQPAPPAPLFPPELIRLSRRLPLDNYRLPLPAAPAPPLAPRRAAIPTAPTVPLGWGHRITFFTAITGITGCPATTAITAIPFCLLVPTPCRPCHTSPST